MWKVDLWRSKILLMFLQILNWPSYVQARELNGISVKNVPLSSVQIETFQKQENLEILGCEHELMINRLVVGRVNAETHEKFTVIELRAVV